MKEVADRVKDGEALAGPLQLAQAAFPAIGTQMLAVGEETGSLDSMLHEPGRLL